MFQYDNFIDYKSGCGFVFDVLNKDNIILSIIKHRNGQFVISGNQSSFYKDFKQAYIEGIAKVFGINDSEVIYPPPVKSESSDIIKPMKKVVLSHKVSPYIISPFTYELVYEPHIIKESASCESSSSLGESSSFPRNKPSCIRSNNFTLSLSDSVYEIEYEVVLGGEVINNEVKEVRDVYIELSSLIYEIE